MMTRFFTALIWFTFTASLAAQTIRQIEIEEPEMLPLLTISEGVQLDPAELSQSIRNLYRTGFFSDIQAFQETHADGTITIRFETWRRIVFGTPVFSGKRGMKMKKIEHFQESSYPQGLPFTQERYSRWITELRTYYATMGYPDAVFHDRLEYLDNGRTAIPMVEVMPGRAIIIDQLNMPEGKRISRNVKLRPGDRLDREQMDHDMVELADAFRKDGYFAAAADYSVSLAGYRASVQINVNPGSRFTMEILNADLSPEDEADLLEILQRDGLTDTSISVIRNNLFFLLLNQGIADPVIQVEQSESNIRFVVQEPIRLAVESLELRSDIPLELATPPFFNRLTTSALEREIREQLQEQGYLTPDIQYRYADTSRVLMVNVDPGAIRRIGTVTVLGEAEHLPEMPAIREGAVFSPDAISGDLERGERLLAQQGFYHPTITIEQGEVQGQAIPLQLTVLTDGKRILTGIYIYGNRHVKTADILGMIRKSAGDPVTEPEINRIHERLEESGFFASVEIGRFPIHPGEVTLFIRLQERPLTTIRYGIGFNTDEGVRGSVTLTRNYLFQKELTGTLLARVSTKRQQFYLNVSGRSHLMASAFALLEKKNDYEVSRTGISFSYSGTLGRYMNYISSLEFRRNKWWDVEIPEDEIERELHPVDVISFNTQFLLDRRDDILYPRSGYYLSFRLEPTWDTDQDQFYFKYMEKFSVFLNRFAVSQTFGHITGAPDGYAVPLPERFFTGGTNSLRISSFEEAGPLFPSGSPMGGRVLVLFNVEYHVPLTKDMEGVLFLDIGNVWHELSDVSFDSMIKDIGVGIRYRTPLGPIRAELAYNLDKDTFPSSWKLQLSIGNTF